MPTAAQRIADLERQLAELRKSVDKTAFVLEVFYDAGFADGRASITGHRNRPREAAARTLHGSHLRPVNGGAR